MSENAVVFRAAQQKMTYSLRQIESNCQSEQSEDRHWWHLLMAVREFEDNHADYRAKLNCYRDLCSGSHWTASLVFTAMANNDRVIDHSVRQLRRDLHMALCDYALTPESTELLLSQLSDFSQFAANSLVIEVDLISQMLDTLFKVDMQISHLAH